MVSRRSRPSPPPRAQQRSAQALAREAALDAAIVTVLNRLNTAAKAGDTTHVTRQSVVIKALGLIAATRFRPLTITGPYYRLTTAFPQQRARLSPAPRLLSWTSSEHVD
jgi:hypothetical protein